MEGQPKGRKVWFFESLSTALEELLVLGNGLGKLLVSVIKSVNI